MPLDCLSCGFRHARLQKAHRMRDHDEFAYIPRVLQGSSQNMAKVKNSPTKEVKTATSKAMVEVMSSSNANIGTGHAIEPAKGKLGVMIPGMGAVATTFVAGVEAVRKGIAHPIGSLTQMGTIRLGERTEGRSPKINDFVPLAGLDDLVFTGWDIFEDDMYSAARNAGVLEVSLLDQVKPFLSSIKPRKAVFDKN